MRLIARAAVFALAFCVSLVVLSLFAVLGIPILAARFGASVAELWR